MAKNLIEVIIRAQDDASKKMLAVSQATESMGKRIQNVSRVMAVGGAAITAAIGGVIYKTAQWADNLRDLSQRLGVSTEFLSQLEYALQTTGASIDSFAIAMKVLSTNALDAANGSKTAEALFHDLGVSVTDNNGKLKDSEQLFFEVADAIAKCTDDTMRLALASKIFGRGAGELIPLLRGGSAGIRELMDAAKRLGVTLTKDGADKADAFNDSLVGIKASIKGVGLALLDDFGPQATAFADKISETIPKVGEWITKNDELVKSLGAITIGLTGLSLGITALGPALSLLSKHPLFLAFGVGYTGAVLFDKAVRAIGIGNPLQNIINAWARLGGEIKAADEEAAKAPQNILIAWKGLYTIPHMGPTPGPMSGLAADYVKKAWDAATEAAKKYAEVQKNILDGIPSEPRGPGITDVYSQRYPLGAAAPGGPTVWPDEGINRSAKATERWRKSVFDVRDEIQQIPELVNKSAERMNWMADQFAVTWEDASMRLTESITDAFMLIFEEGKNTWEQLGQIVKQFVKESIRELIRLMVWKVITNIASGGTSGAVGTNPMPMFPMGQHGLEAVGGRWGKDTIPVVMSRGEVVTPAPTVERLNRFMDRGGGQGGGISLYTLFYSGSRDEANQAGSYIDRKRASFEKCIVQGTL